MNAPRVRWVVLAFVAGLYLALKAAHLVPVEALRVGN
jgi:ABC-type lipoprotein release transport system permease subunit